MDSQGPRPLEQLSLPAREFVGPRQAGKSSCMFVAKDIAVTAGVQDIAAFHRALGLLSARAGMLLNATDVGQSAGVKGQTVSAWLDLLEQNALARALARHRGKLGIQNVDPMLIPAALSRQVPALREVWIVTPGGERTRLSSTSIWLPIRTLTQRLSEIATETIA